MDWAEALAALQGSDLANKADIIAAVKKQVSVVIGEKNTMAGRLAETETTIAAIVEGTKATGESMGDKLKDAAAKVVALHTAAAAKDAAIVELTSKTSTLEGEKTALANKATLQAIGAKKGANPAVLASLIPDASKVTVEGDIVKVDGKDWDEWLKGDGVAPFVPALLPLAGKPNTPSLPPLPNGKAEDGKVTSIYDAVRRKPWTPKGTA